MNNVLVKDPFIKEKHHSSKPLYSALVPDEIFNASKGALTNPTVLFIMISNPTRLEGYFYDSHHRLKHMRKTLQFNSEESPIVDERFVAGIIEEHGIDSDEYRIRVK